MNFLAAEPFEHHRKNGLPLRLVMTGSRNRKNKGFSSSYL
jgi:hypothetical protein